MLVYLPLNSFFADPVKVFLEQEFFISKTGKVGRIIEYNAPPPPTPPPTRPQLSGKTVKDLDHALNYENLFKDNNTTTPFFLLHIVVPINIFM
jgi:hypothetical protein